MSLDIVARYGGVVRELRGLRGELAEVDIAHARRKAAAWASSHESTATGREAEAGHATVDLRTSGIELRCQIDQLEDERLYLRDLLKLRILTLE